MNWNRLERPEQLKEIITESADNNILIFKHSTRCSISEAAKYRLDADLDALKSVYDVHYLDLLTYRDISKLVAERFDVIHQSPQVIVVQKGKPTYTASHYDIDVRDLMAQVRTENR